MAQAEAKRTGGAKGVMYALALGDRSRTRAGLRRALPDAWATGQIDLAYQTVVDLHTGEVMGMESLLRWRHPQMDPISPPDAIETAIELGLIVDLELQILGRAQSDLAAAEVPARLRVGVNLAAPQLRPAATDLLLAAVLDSGKADQLWLEVTEQLLVQEERYAAAALADLRAAGVLIAIDDFGTGFCSLDYLCSLPVDLIKLDKVFALHCDDPVRQEVSRTVTQLAAALGAEVIAEGVETWEAARTMAALGCRFGQGYGLRRSAMSVPEASAPVEFPPGLLRSAPVPRPRSHGDRLSAQGVSGPGQDQ